MSSATSVSDALAGYLAGRVTADQLAAVVAGEYYGARGSRLGAGLKPLIEIIERAHPGVVELSGVADRPGFTVRLAERPFPKRYEPQLREAVQTVLETGPAGLSPSPQPRAPSPGLLTRLIRAIRNIFSA